MSGTIRFDDKHIVKFVLDEENSVIYVTVILDGEQYDGTVSLEDTPGV